jgi:1D-myo-inositol-triphosphate 3-kinase
METLLVAKMEKAGACLTSSSPPPSLPPALLLRTDSTDSASSLSSTSSDVCRCDDCLLGIADLYVTTPEEEARCRKKVGQQFDFI